jgi:hypothetical protein
MSPDAADHEDVPPRIDRFARLICVALAVVLSAVAGIAWRSGGHAVLYGICGSAALLLLVTATVGPQRWRVGLLHLLTSL